MEVAGKQHHGARGCDLVEHLGRGRVVPQRIPVAVPDEWCRHVELRLETGSHDVGGHRRTGGSGQIEPSPHDGPLREMHMVIPQPRHDPAALERDALGVRVRGGGIGEQSVADQKPSGGGGSGEPRIGQQEVGHASAAFLRAGVASG
ncbi:hypothetical protein GCM10025876_37950 [Demequina litorisediminis]|uniref:Uncharacterized protein n=1 Tax=Demequina litorisediminis TaxID=1849022 RepID=A0ABQ6IKH1_9MICO|nr:hypothetical protein GCM10025876_37950 [Demequina litorisediminis]